MKSKSQILRQLKELRFSQEDWEAVSGFLKGVGVKGKRTAKRKAAECSYAEFMEWYRNGAASGDIVGCGGSAVIVSFAFKDTIIYCGFFGLDGELCAVEQPVAANVEARRDLSQEEAERYRRTYLMSGYVVDEENGMLIAKPKPEVGKVYEFCHDGKVLMGYLRKTRHGYAMFKYGCNENTLIDKCVDVEDHNVMRLIEGKELDGFVEMMRMKHGYSWDSVREELMTLPSRQDKGKPYFYITENFTVSGANDWRTSKTNRHYWAGNYFATKEEAVSFLEGVKKERAEQIKTQLLSQAVG